MGAIADVEYSVDCASVGGASRTDDSCCSWICWKAFHRLAHIFRIVSCQPVQDISNASTDEERSRVVKFTAERDWAAYFLKFSIICDFPPVQLARYLYFLIIFDIYSGEYRIIVNITISNRRIRSRGNTSHVVLKDRPWPRGQEIMYLALRVLALVLVSRVLTVTSCMQKLFSVMFGCNTGCRLLQIVVSALLIFRLYLLGF